MSLRSMMVAACALSLVVGCGDDTVNPDASALDAGAMDAGGGGTDGGPDVALDASDDDAGLSPGRCGDGELNAGEQCDDGNRADGDGCNMACQLECGDGMLQTGEICDPGIAAGETGACPTDCDDSDPCTIDVMTGTGCSVECSNAPITLPIDGDMCCPEGADARIDSDCTAMCGNMILEPTETCEAGTAVACPTSCDDMNSCTTDTLGGGTATCDAACTYADITACSSVSDGCCPSGCDSGSDVDCSATCGNGVLDSGELCEEGTGTPCPTACDDGLACTADALVGSAATCNAECSATPITTCSTVSDGCCPGTCNATNDGDCAAVCGNGVLEAGEECDDGNTTNGDGCSMTCATEVAPPTAFRLDDFDIMDPHIWLDVPFFGCTDFTNRGLAGQPSLNQRLETGVQTDTDADGLLDLSILTVFRPLSQAAATSPMSVSFPACSAPMSSTSCVLAAGGTRVDATATNMTSGTCLGVLPGTVRPYSPAVADVVAGAAPCFVSDEQTLTVSLGGAAITLRRAQVGATYTGSPATSLSNGLIRGFLSEADADATMIDVPTMGLQPISSLLAGGTGACAPGDDRDTIMGPGGAAITGWWFYFYFSSASPVPYSEL